MNCTFYKKQTVAEVFSKKLETRSNRDSVNDLSRSTLQETTQDILKIRLSPASVSMTFHGFNDQIKQGDVISVAEEKGQVIAFMNHRTGKSGLASSKLSASDWWGFIFLAMFPAGICGGIFFYTYRKDGLTAGNLFAVAIGLFLIIRLYLAATNNKDAKSALKELKRMDRLDRNQLRD